MNRWEIRQRASALHQMAMDVGAKNTAAILSKMEGAVSGVGAGDKPSSDEMDALKTLVLIARTTFQMERVQLSEALGNLRTGLRELKI
jgi:hypothetical protein